MFFVFTWNFFFQLTHVSNIKRHGPNSISVSHFLRPSFKSNYFFILYYCWCKKNTISSLLEFQQQFFVFFLIFGTVLHYIDIDVSTQTVCFGWLGPTFFAFKKCFNIRISGIGISLGKKKDNGIPSCCKIYNAFVPIFICRLIIANHEVIVNIFYLIKELRGVSRFIFGFFTPTHTKIVTRPTTNIFYHMYLFSKCYYCWCK